MSEGPAGAKQSKLQLSSLFLARGPSQYQGRTVFCSWLQ